MQIFIELSILMVIAVLLLGGGLTYPLIAGALL